MNNVKNFYDLINSLLKKTVDKAPDIIFCIIVSVLAFISIKLSKKGINKYFEKINKLNSNVSKICLKSVKLGIIFSAAFLILAKFNIPITAFFAIFSSSLVAVGLALKDFFCNIAKSFQIKLTSPFAVGDLIEVDSKKGIVKKIDYMHTYITNKEHGLVMVPNALIADKSIINYSRGETKPNHETSNQPNNQTSNQPNNQTSNQPNNQTSN